MTSISLLTVSSRTASVLIRAEGARYRLPFTCHWHLTNKTSQVIQKGSTDNAVVFVVGLKPDTEYSFTTELGYFEFTTPTCTGLIEANSPEPEAVQSNSAAFLQSAIDSVPAGGTLRIPAGRYTTGPLFLHSDMTLLLEEGAELSAIDDWEEWPILPERDEQNRVIGTWEGLPDKSFAALLNAIGCTKVQITGLGVIDGGGDRGDWWSWPKETRRNARRPRTVFLAHCDNVQLSGVTIRNSPSWTVHPFNCRNLRAASLTIENPPDSPNTDGFNPESCENVSLTGIHFSVGDDCIAIKSGKRAGNRTDHLAPTRDVSITHCLMERGHGAVVLGSEMSGDISDVSISNCQFVGTDRGLRIKTRRGRGGKVSGIRMTDVDMNKVDTAISANAFYFCDADGKSEHVQSRMAAVVSEETPEVSDISVSNVTAENVRLVAVALLGLPEAPIASFHLKNMKLTFDPDAVPAVPLMACDVAPCRHETIIAEFAEVIGGISKFQKEGAPC